MHEFPDPYGVCALDAVTEIRAVASAQFVVPLTERGTAYGDLVSCLEMRRVVTGRVG